MSIGSRVGGGTPSGRNVGGWVEAKHLASYAGLLWEGVEQYCMDRSDGWMECLG